MDEFFENYQSNNSQELYNDLAVLYDFIYNIHYDYQNQKNIVDKYSNNNTNRILEGACGTGRLTRRLRDDYYVKAFDYNKSMLNIAKYRDKNYEHLYKIDDYTNLGIDEKFDMYCVLGNSLVHIKEEDDFRLFAEESYEVLNKNGELLFDYMPEKEMKEYSGEDIFESEDYRVERDIITTKESKYIYTMTFHFDIENKQTGELIKTGDSMISRCYDRDFIDRNLSDAGYRSINYLNPDSTSAEIKDGVVSANK
jgi:ubiquinone/menaquinone biosynthesis C-methylase UbiE